MIYYDDVLVDWKNGTKPQEIEVKQEIEAIRKKYYGPTAKGVAVLRWDQGARVKNETGNWELKRIYPIKLLSADGMWRYTSSKPSKVGAGAPPTYAINHIYVKDETPYFEADIELLWYLSGKSADVQARILRFEDPAAEAKKKVAVMSDDTEIKFYLMGKTSPLYNDEDALRSIAAAFGIENDQRLNIDELKVAIYDAVSTGQKRGDRACNYDLFMEFTQAEDKHRYASKCRKAITDGDLYFDKKEYAWFLKGQNDPFLKLKGTEVDTAVSMVVDKVINSPAHAVSLMKFYNEEATLTVDIVNTLKRPALLRIAKECGAEFTPTDKNEELQQKIIYKLGLS